MKKYLLVFLFAIATIAAPLSSNATENTDSIVAVVGDQVITRQDLDRRFQLVMRQMNKKVTGEQREQLYSRTLGVLVDEELKRQKAHSVGIEVSEDEIFARSSALPQRAGISNQEFLKIIIGLEDTLKAQIEAEALWDKFVDRNIRSRITVSNEEIDHLISNLAAGQEVVENQVSQIFISAESPNADATIERIYTDLENGGDFAQIAQQESEHFTATQGGYMGWFKSGEMAPQLEDKIRPLQVGDFTRPIRSQSGWHILHLDNRRTAGLVNMEPINHVHLVQFVATIPEDSDKKKAVFDIMKKIAKDVKTLTDAEEVLEDANIKKLLSPTSGSLGWLEEKNIPPLLKPHTKDLKQGEAEGPFEEGQQVIVLFMAQEVKKISDKLEKYRSKVEKRIVDNRAELAARRYIRDLRRGTFIDIRLGQ